MAPLSSATPVPPSIVVDGGERGVCSDALTWMARAFGPVDAEAYGEYLDGLGGPVEPIRHVTPPAAAQILARGRALQRKRQAERRRYRARRAAA